MARFDDHPEQYANRIIPTLQEPNEIWRAAYDNGEFRLHYIKAWSDGKGTLAIVTEHPEERLHLYDFICESISTLDHYRLGTLLYVDENRERG